VGVATKNRRKIAVDGRQYVWHVAVNWDGPGMLLHVASADKQLIVKYLLNQSPGEDYMAVFGRRRFAGWPSQPKGSYDSSWKRFLCPHFGGDIITPRDVRRLIEWCLDATLVREEISWETHRNIV
jgi:hypothetical protein